MMKLGHFFLGLFIFLAGCRADISANPMQIASLASEIPNVGYVDTHQHYAHTGVVDRSKFPYFKKYNGKSAIAVTFDCAWVNEQNGMEILEVLKRHNIKTTFFVSGPFIFKDFNQGLAGGLNRANFPMIRKMIEDGHEFGNHTQTHPHNSPQIGWSQEVSELKRGWDAVVREIFGAIPPDNARMLDFWRAPFGQYDHRSLSLAAQAGYPFHFGWNVDTRDSVGLPDCRVDSANPRCLSPGKITQTVIRFAELNQWDLDAFVVLAHLSNAYRWGSTVDGFDKLVSTFRGRGFEFVRVSDVFRRDLLSGN